jgi:hypothetical protein
MITGHAENGIRYKNRPSDPMSRVANRAGLSKASAFPPRAPFFLSGTRINHR